MLSHLFVYIELRTASHMKCWDPEKKIFCVNFKRVPRRASQAMNTMPVLKASRTRQNHWSSRDGSWSNLGGMHHWKGCIEWGVKGAQRHMCGLHLIMILYLKSEKSTRIKILGRAGWEVWLLWTLYEVCVQIWAHTQNRLEGTACSWYGHSLWTTELNNWVPHSNHLITKNIELPLKDQWSWPSLSPDS